MAAAKRYSVEQIIASLREMERLQPSAVSVLAACKKPGVSDEAFCWCRVKCGQLRVNGAQRLKGLEEEYSRLTRIVADQTLRISMLREVSRGNS